jgi:adenine-specific DNA-methyltransferase
MATDKNEHGQYFTPRHIADMMVALIGSTEEEKILEPSSGAGVFLDSLIAAGRTNLCAVEIDPKFAKHPNVEVECHSYISWKSTEKFRTIIGNPPYIRWKNLAEAQKNELMKDANWGTLFNALSDYLMVFIVKSIERLSTGGELIFITPSFWLNTQHAEPVRNYMVQNGVFTHLVSFGESKVFEGVSSSIVIFRWIKQSEPLKKIKYFEFIGGRNVKPIDTDLMDLSLYKALEIRQFEANSTWTLASENELAKTSKFENWTASSVDSDQLWDEHRYRTLGDFCDIANGMVSGYDKAFRINSDLLSKLNKTELNAIQQVVKGSDLNHLVSSKTTPYIDLPLNLTELKFKEEYPLLYQHLSGFRQELDNRYSYGRNLPFWEWSFRRSEKFFKNGRTKIFVPCKERITNKDRVRFSLAPKDAIPTQDVTAFSPKLEVQESAEFIAAFLSLRSVTEWIRIKGLVKGGIAEFSERPLASIPFRPINWQDAEEVSIHESITKLLLNHSEYDFKTIESEISYLFSQLGWNES